MQPYTRDIELLVQIADLLGDIMVYCGSEMAKYGLPQGEILGIIMDSNFSKLGEDGKPIYDDRGKVQKARTTGGLNQRSRSCCLIAVRRAGNHSTTTRSTRS